MLKEEICDGDWVEDKFTGQGKRTFPNGDVYNGDWQAWYMEGKGTMVYADGKKYEGEWVHDKRHGTGSLYDADGFVIEMGKWIEDVCNSDAANSGISLD
jgi:hypothetical protein